MPIVYRSVKGSNLTAAEVDGNFSYIDTRIDTAEANQPQPVEITNIYQIGTSFYIEMEDSTEWGPFTLPRAVAVATVQTDATTSKTLAATDAGNYIRCTNVAGCTVEVPDNDTVTFAVGEEIHFRQCNTGPVTFESGSGVILNLPDGDDAQTSRQGAVCTLKKIATDEWDIFGDLIELGTDDTDDFTGTV